MKESDTRNDQNNWIDANTKKQNANGAEAKEGKGRDTSISLSMHNKVSDNKQTKKES